MIKTIGIGNDHTGIALKQAICEYLSAQGYTIVNYGVDQLIKDDNYPEIAYPLSVDVANGKLDAGILICGTGIGMSLSANKVKGIRAVVVSEPYSAKMARIHNNANILCFGARVVGVELAKMIVDNWLHHEFEGGRHQKRIDMISAIENGTFGCK